MPREKQNERTKLFCTDERGGGRTRGTGQSRDARKLNKGKNLNKVKGGSQKSCISFAENQMELVTAASALSCHKRLIAKVLDTQGGWSNDAISVVQVPHCSPKQRGVFVRRHFSWQKQFRNSTAAKSLLANQLSKIAYVTMMKARVIIVQGAYGALGRGLTIALRYKAFRKQGSLTVRRASLVARGHPVQQFRMFPLVGATFGTFFGAKRLLALLKAFDASVKAAGKDLEKIETSMLPELHATSAGLKAFCTEMAANGLEEARKCCGGQGYTMSSGIAKLVVDYMPAVTYEGTASRWHSRQHALLSELSRGRSPSRAALRTWAARITHQ